MRNWLKWLILPVLILGFMLTSSFGDNVYADDDGTDDNIKYFTIDITYFTAQRTCWSNTKTCRIDDASEQKVETVEISKQNGDFKINNTNNATVGGILFALNNDYLKVGYHELTGLDTSNSNFMSTWGGGSEYTTETIRLSGKTVSRAWQAVRTKLNNHVIYTYHYDESVYNGSKSTLGMYRVAVNEVRTRDASSGTTGTAGSLQDQNVDGLTETGNSDATCMSEAGTTLGWILCPISDALNGAAGWAYDSLLKPALEINPQLFTQESTSSTTGTSATTQQAWDVFRNIANTLFIILFLVVIFSQLTGVGIDNYGIKKILPKLIVAAVLMNLSYWICLVFVDLSNILGNSLQSLLTNLPPANNQLPETVGGVDFGERFWEGAGGVATFVAVLGVLAGGVGVSIMAAGGGVAFLISILVAGLGAVVGIFFLFLLLAAREAAIVVLVVISPLAFACNMLPNTQDLFKKWWQIGWKLLLVYPIAGLLIGGGDYVSRLLLLSGAGGEGFFSAFAAIIVGIVPIFFIPSVLKSSFAAMGNLGAKISGIGQKVGGQLSGATDKTIRGSERFKNYQSDRDRQRKIESARRTAARFEGRDPNSLSGRQQRAFTQARSILLGEEAEERKRGSLLNGGYEAAMAGIASSADAEMVKNEEALIMNDVGLRDNVGSLQVGLEEAIASENDSQIRAYQNVLSRKGDAGREAVRQAMVNAQGRGDVSQKSAQTYASNLMNNWASDYKDNSRSTYDYANEVLGGQDKPSLTQNRSAKFESLKTSQIANMDDTEFDRLLAENGVQFDNDGKLVNADGIKGEFADLAYNTLQDTNATTGAKEKRLNALRRIAAVSSGVQQQTAQQQAAQQIAQQQDQMAQNLQNINDILSQHGGGGNP